MRTKPPKALWPQAGLSTVELALMLSLLLPLVMSTLQAAIWLQRHWQMEESAMAAARYVSLIEPSAWLDQNLVDEQISKRCANFSELLKQHQSNFRLLQCARIDMKTIEVLLHADATGLLKEASLQSRWTLAFNLK